MQPSLDAPPGHVVRLLPDYAGTVLWLQSAVPYDDTQLDPDLVTDLIRWEIEYYDALDDTFTWRSPAHASRFTAAGVNLALRLAMQLGSGFDIEFASYEAGVASRRFRSDFVADNPAAAAAFTALAGAVDDVRPITHSDNAEGGSFLAPFRPPRGAVISPSDSLTE